MILLLGLQATPTFAQNDDFVKQFQQARQGMMDDYNKFRNTILTDYDKYMQGAWKEYKMKAAHSAPAICRRMQNWARTWS